MADDPIEEAMRGIDLHADGMVKLADVLPRVRDLVAAETERCIAIVRDLADAYGPSSEAAASVFDMVLRHLDPAALQASSSSPVTPEPETYPTGASTQWCPNQHDGERRMVESGGCWNCPTCRAVMLVQSLAVTPEPEEPT